MSDTPQVPDDGAAQEGGYGYPTLEQEVTPEVLAAGSGYDEAGGSALAGTGSDEAGGPARAGTEPDEEDDDGPTPGELEEQPSAVEPTD